MAKCDPAEIFYSSGRFVMKIQYIITILLFLSFGSLIHSYGQEDQRPVRLGICYGTGTQQIFPYNNKDYIYNVNGYKILINHPVGITGKLSYELQFEPGIYFAKHQLLNEYFVQPKDGTDYLEQRKIFTQEKTITEYVLNAGFQVRYCIKPGLSLSLIGGIGPIYSDTETERLARGFAFSDVVAIGMAYKTGKLMFEIRPGLRHVSNADLKYPNSGHNSSNIDFGISVFL
jgi:hypothetical protein